MAPLKVIVIGAGNRGTKYATLMSQMPDMYQVVAVADPGKAPREHIQQMYNLPDSACYTDWKDILAQPKMADIAIITTVDAMHYEPALKAIDLGYHLLLEKPVAQTAEECAEIAAAAKKKGVSVLVCHVLRYAPFFKRVKETIMAGTIGDVLSVVHVEAVGNVHQSHSLSAEIGTARKNPPPCFCRKAATTWILSSGFWENPARKFNPSAV